MDKVLALSPEGRPYVLETESGDVPADPRLDRVARTFARAPAEGLFSLAAREAGRGELPPSFAFFRDLSSRYLIALCRSGADRGWVSLSPPPEEELGQLVAAAPPLLGGEYLSPGVLRELWSDLDRWVEEQVSAGKGGLGEFLESKAPAWKRVGRVSFHLAENKRDGDHPFAFLATYAPRLSTGGAVQYQPLSQALTEYAGVSNKEALVRLLSPVRVAAEKSALVRDLLESGDLFHPLAWTPREAHAFLKEVPLLEESGVLVRVPDWWRKRPRPRVGVTIGESKRNHLDMGTLLDFRVDLALGDEKLTAGEWRALLATGDGLVQLKGQWVEVDHERLEQALDHWKNVEREAASGGISFAEGMRLLAGATSDLGAGDGEDEIQRDWSFVNAGAWLGETLARLRDPALLAEVRPGKELKATLRPYQQAGIDWLWFLSSLGLGACLADDMGLGKTIQVLALLLAAKKARKAKEAQKDRPPSLVVAPASLLSNWKAEIEKFAPGLDARYFHPSETKGDELLRMAARSGKALDGADVVLTTYGMVLRHDWMRERPWRIVVLDEAQAIKNPSAGQTRAVKKLRGEARIALTGTPVENRLSDLWSLFDFLCPGLLGSRDRFKKFVGSLEARPSDRFSPLRRLVQPYLLRRLKTDRAIIADLPEKTEVKVRSGLAKRQAALYQKVVNDLELTLERSDGIQRKGLVLAALLKLKQVCNHPSQLLGDGAWEPADSGKFARLRMLGEEIASRQERALVFTQFREMTEPLARFLAQVFGRDGLILHGGTQVARRRRLVESFQSPQGPPFFILSLKAGGTGLNLTAASHVIHFDRWWNPAVENQATDRAFRIGQKRNVVVHKFVCQGTVEERIDALIEEKRELARDVVEGGGERLLTEMNDKELLRLVALDVDRAGV